MRAFDKLFCLFLMLVVLLTFSSARTQPSRERKNMIDTKSILGKTVFAYTFSKSDFKKIEMRKKLINKIIESVEEEPF